MPAAFRRLVTLVPQSQSLEPQARGLGESGASKDWRALLGERIQTLEIVAAVVRLPAQLLDALVHLRRDRLVIGEDPKLFLDDRDRQRGLRRHRCGQLQGERLKPVRRDQVIYDQAFSGFAGVKGRRGKE